MLVPISLSVPPQIIDPVVPDDRMAVARSESARTIPSPQRLRLSDLPDEIVAAVLAFVTDIRDLINSACVSWRFKDLSEPHLYKNVAVLEEYQAQRLSAAIRTKEVRAKWIQSFLISPTFPHHTGLKDLPNNISKMRNLRTLRLETPDLNREQSRARRPWIDLQERYERVFQQASLLVPNPSNRELPFLEECTLHFVDSRTELYGLSRYSALFLHPNLRSLTISCASSDLPRELLPGIRDDSFLQRQTNLTNLHLEECDLNADTLAKILRFPRALKRLKISEGTRYTVHNSFHPRRHGDMQPPELIRALTEQADSLEYLSLSLGYLRPPFMTINDHGEQLDLRELTSLKTLEMCHRTLHLVRTALGNCDHGLRRRLPANLQTLVVFEIPMGMARMPLQMHLEHAYLPFHSCMFRKSECGLPSLQQLILKYAFYGQEDERGDAEDDFRPSQLLRVKELIKVKARTYMKDMKKSGMNLRIDQVNLPVGFIPPYLTKEKKPHEAVLWDSRVEPSPLT